MEARQRRHRSRSKRRGRFRGLYQLLSVLAVTAAIAVACVVFFRVNVIEVTGNARYTAQEVVEASGIAIGDNLAALPQGEIASRIRTRLPYVESVAIHRLLPDGVRLVVKERVAAASVAGADGNRYLVSATGRLLELDPGEGAMTLTGLTALNPAVGGTLTVAEEEAPRLEYVQSLLSALEEREMLGECTALDCTQELTFTLTYQIYQVKLPATADYTDELRLLRGALESGELPQGVAGTFDLTVEAGKAFFRPSAS